MLSYLHHGKRELPSLIFLHGFLGCKEDFLPLIHLLKEEYSCFSFDLPYHGRSAAEAFSLDGAKDLIEKSATSLQIDKPIFIGYSLGGRIALHLEQKALIISSHLGLKTDIEREERYKKEKSIAKKIEENFEEFLYFWYDLPLFSNLKRCTSFEEMLLRRRQNSPDKMIKALHAFSLCKQREFFPSKMQIFIAGEEDKAYLSHYKERGCNNKIIKGASHAPHIETPERAYGTIRDAIRRLERDTRL